LIAPQDAAVEYVPARSRSRQRFSSGGIGFVVTLIIWGERDPLVPVRHAHEAHERIPGSRHFNAAGKGGDVQ
jgi:hypothetical protein